MTDRLTEYALIIDLENQKTSRRVIPSHIVKLFLGGAGVGLRLWAELTPPRVDPLSPENTLIISAGALSGTLMPGCSKVTGICSMPTVASDEGLHFVACSVAGSRDLGLMMKAAGWNHIILCGQAEKPVILLIDDNEISFIPADDLWGKTGTETCSTKLRERFGNNVGTITIGEAGENKVLYSMAIVDMAHSLGRSGIGAVMGSKKVKGIVVRGSHGLNISDVDRLTSAAEHTIDRVKEWENLAVWSKLGMGGGWSTFRYTQNPGKWPIDDWDKLYGQDKRMETLDQVLACSGCHLGCRIKWRHRTGEFKGEVGYGSPYGKSATGGQLLGVKDISKMLHLVAIANEAGLDFYTWTRLIDWFTSLADQNLIDKEQPGIYLRRDYDCYLRLLEMVIHRDGIGNLLAEGWLPVAKHIGRDCQEYWYAGISKGTDFIYDARSARMHPLMFTFITNPRPHHGGTHTESTSVGKPVEKISGQFKEWGIDTKNLVEYEPEPMLHVGQMTKYVENAMMVRNALGACSMYSAFGLEHMQDLLEAYNSTFSEELTLDNLMIAGDRLFNLLKWINMREGFGRQHDKVPELWLRPMNTPEGIINTMDYYGRHRITEEDFQIMLEDYYSERGWDADTGSPSEQLLVNLGLDWMEDNDNVSGAQG